MHGPLRSATFCALLFGAAIAAAPSEAQQGGGPAVGTAAAAAGAMLTQRDATVQSRVVATERMEMELVPERLSIQPGGEFWVALRMRTEPDWYTYWRFGGDAGDGARIDWSLPEGFSADGIVWPYPQLKVMERAAVYIYEGEAFLLNRLEAPADLQPGTTVKISAQIEYIICDAEGCYPEELEASVRVPVTAEAPAADPRWAGAFYDTWARVPVEPEGWELSAGWRGDRLLLRARPPAGVVPDVDGVYFFAGMPELIDYPAPQRVSYRNGVLLLELEKSTWATTLAERAAGALVVPLLGDDGIPTALEVDVPVLGMEELARLVPVDGGGGLPPSLWLALGLAFVGGLLLNLMPCVFPVVSLKVLGFVRLAGERPAEVRRHAFSFAGGVLVAFWALAGLLILLRHAGAEIGWGFQLQSQGFIAFMTFLLFAIGLSLAGVFELGTSLGRLGNLAPRASGYTGSALNGVLATVVATPCTAPFMGAALGFALTLSAAGSLLIFTALAVGMAAPYVVLSLAPALLRYLPRPGAWMQTFRQALSFPLFATAAWLVWVFGHQAGVDGVLRLLLGLTLLAMAAWCWGRWGSALNGTRAVRLTGRTVAGAFLVGGFALALGSAPLPAADGRLGATLAAGPAGAGSNGARIQWEEFSAEAVTRHREAGRIVFIDFTAAWCLTCKVNERVALNVPEVVALVGELDIAMLKADWTTRDPAIARALGEFGRSGVPLYVVYPADPFEAPRLLPELLTPAIVIRALHEVSS
jgi:thiol:disulfide interchange protein/DsbC/DsbD-like thiol-disulfide interchange protein